ncbi:MAG: sigma-54-dependent transcriptional regulator [bacterium]
MAEILIVDDEKELLDGCAEILKALGHQVVPLTSGEQALEIIELQEFDLILCDLFMPEVNGMKVLEKAQEVIPQTPFIIFTAFGTIDRAVTAMKNGAFDFLEKPFDVEHLKIVLDKGLKQRNLYCERHELLKQLQEKYSFENIIGRSLKMQRIFELIDTVATSSASVMITGESGTGKELVARGIHVRSNRRTKSFMPVNCGAFPENLFESELFGYEKGAFTGATRRKPGLMEMANGGTFFLDEVCELPESLQVKLLRVLQDQKVRRLGGDELIDVDLRFIAATNRNLETAVQEGRLREDFYYRLNVVNMHIPALRERKDDIRLLAEHFLRKFVKSSPKEIKGFSEQVLHCLDNYDWPGNVRELENMVERAVALSQSSLITMNDFPPQIQVQNIPTSSLTHLTLVEAKQKLIEGFERKYLLELLHKLHGNVTKIASEAGMTRRNLHRLLKRHGLEADAWRHPKQPQR